MKYFQGTLCLLFCLFVCGCVTTAKNIKPEQKIDQNNGILVTRLHSNWSGYDNFFQADIELIFTTKTGTNKSFKLVQSRPADLKVIDLPTGVYNWHRIVFGNYYLDLNGSFTIQPNEITYIGDILTAVSMGMFSMSGQSTVTNKYEKTIQALKHEYPKLASKYKINTQLTSLH